MLWQLFHYVPLNADSWQRMTEHQTLEVCAACAGGGGGGLPTRLTRTAHDPAAVAAAAHPCCRLLLLACGGPQVQWEAYQTANERFNSVVLDAYQPGDIVWVQDYHLMLLPSLLKAAVPRMKVGGRWAGCGVCASDS